MIVSLAKASNTNSHPVELSKPSDIEQKSILAEPRQKDVDPYPTDREKLEKALGNPTARIQRKLFFAFGLVIACLSSLLMLNGGITSNSTQPALSHMDNTITLSVANGEFGAYGCHESIVKHADHAFSLKCSGFELNNSIGALTMLQSGLADLSIVSQSDFDSWKANVSPDAVAMLSVLGHSAGEAVLLVSETSSLEKKKVLIEQYVKALYGVQWGEDIDLLLNSNLSHEYLPTDNTTALIPLSEGLAQLSESEPLDWIAALADIKQPVLPLVAKPSTQESDNSVSTQEVHSEFEEVHKLIMDWTQGPLGKVVALMMIMIGLMNGIVRQDLFGAVSGIAGGLIIYQAPVVINTILLGARG